MILIVPPRSRAFRLRCQLHRKRKPQLQIGCRGALASIESRESSCRGFEIPGRDNVLRAFCFLYEVEPDVHVILLGELGFANQLGMNSWAHHIAAG
jgi:hypothetical protein